MFYHVDELCMLGEMNIISMFVYVRCNENHPRQLEEDITKIILLFPSSYFSGRGEPCVQKVRSFRNVFNQIIGKTHLKRN